MILTTLAVLFGILFILFLFNCPEDKNAMRK